MMLFFMVFFSSFFLVFDVDDWFMIWLGLEINMFSFMLIIVKKNSIEIESCLKYFFIQSLGSGILLMSFYFQGMISFFINGIVLSYKVGGGPFYFWFPSLCESVSWISCYFLMTIQKVISFMLLSKYSSEIILFLGFISLFIGVMGSFSQSKLKRLMAYSSIHHIGWMMICVMINEFLWLIYLLMYMFMMYGIFEIFNKNNMLSISFMSSGVESWIIILGMMSMGGIPPMLGFFLSWWIFYMMNFTMNFMFMYMVLMAIIMLYIYMRVVYSLLMMETKVLNISMFHMENHLSLGSCLYIYGLIVGSFLGLLIVTFKFKM